VSADGINSCDTNEHETEFDIWWDREGRGMARGKHESSEEYCARVACVAWKNGEFCGVRKHKHEFKCKNIQKKVIQIVSKQLLIDNSKITCDSNPVDDLGADSLDIIELVMAFEEEFSIEISDDEEVEHGITIGKIIDFIDDKRLLDTYR